MKLLILTQKVDVHDPVLGFFHTWIAAFAKQCESVIVVCLEKGEYQLPSNVQVLSLGKEAHVSRISYLKNFYRFIFKYRRQYDAVFVHMNPEYFILGGPLWRWWGKRMSLWYVHKAVNLRLQLAEKLVHTVFTASRESFRLASTKVNILGHGIPVDQIALREPRQIVRSTRLCWVGRISPVKDVETVILAMHHLRVGGLDVTLDIIGDPVTVLDREYEKTLVALIHELQLESIIHLVGAMSFARLANEYQTYDLLLHTSKTGSVDKVVLEALAAGLQVITSSEAFAYLGDLVHQFPANDSQKLAQSIEKIVESGILTGTNNAGRAFVAAHHNLETLIGNIVQNFSA